MTKEMCIDNYLGLNFDVITLEDCIELHEECDGFVFINDGHITTVVRGDWDW